MSDHKGAAMMLPGLPPARELLADRGYDSNRFRAALLERGITPCIPSTRSRKVEIPYDKTLTASRTCSAASRIGAASPCATIDAHTPSSRPSALQLP
jgi:IS5 family transposase